MTNLAASYRDVGLVSEAAEPQAVVLRKRKLLYGEEHRDTLLVMENLAASYRVLGRPKDAAELRTVVLEKRDYTLGRTTSTL
jgi:hypothetical protein